jgi:uncharacterized protein
LPPPLPFAATNRRRGKVRPPLFPTGGVSNLAWAALAASTFGAALLQAAGGFGFAVVSTPLYLMFVAPVRAVHLVIIIATALSLAVLPGLRRQVEPRLLLRLVVGSVAGLPLGLAAFRRSDPMAVRAAAGTLVLGFAVLLALLRLRSRGGRAAPLAMTCSRDLVAGVASGVATALVGMAGPPVLIYLLLAGAASQVIRATLLAFFALVYVVTLAAHVMTIGIPEGSWVTAGVLLPFAFLGGFVGRPLGDRLGSGGFALLAICLLAVAGLFTLASAAGLVGGE